MDPEGRKAVKNGTYRFVSPAYGEHSNERGEVFPNTLVSVALTNRPALVGLPAVTLSAKEGGWRLLDEQPKPKKKKAKPKKLAAEPAPVRTLEQQAADTGRVLLDRDELVELQAAAGQLHTQRFDVAFREALRERKVTPGEKPLLERMYTLDQGGVLALLDMRQPIMPDRPEGEPAIEFDPYDPEVTFDPADAQRAGMAPDSVILDARVKERLRREHRPLSDYPTVLEAVMREQP